MLAPLVSNQIHTNEKDVAGGDQVSSCCRSFKAQHDYATLGVFCFEFSQRLGLAHNISAMCKYLTSSPVTYPCT